MMQKNKGFTLIELMIVLVIAAILLMVALPGYQNYVRRSQVQGAGADLVALSLVLENMYQRQLQYPLPATNPTTTTAQTLIYTASGNVAQPWAPTRAEQFNYTVQVSSSSYTLRANGISGGLTAGCNLTLNHANVRTISGGSACGGTSKW